MIQTIPKKEKKSRCKEYRSIKAKDKFIKKRKVENQKRFFKNLKQEIRCK